MVLDASVSYQRKDFLSSLDRKSLIEVFVVGLTIGSNVSNYAFIFRLDVRGKNFRSVVPSEKRRQIISSRNFCFHNVN